MKTPFEIKPLLVLNYLPLEIQIQHSNILRQRRGQKGVGPLLYQSWPLGILFDVSNKLYVKEPTSLHPVKMLHTGCVKVKWTKLNGSEG